MLFDSPIISRGSGSLAGLTASRNRGGNYFRARAMPTNPNTTFQQTVRSILAAGSSLWASTLTQAQRDKWDLYAENVPLPNSLGAPINVGGIGMYQRTNVARLNTGGATLTRINVAPGIFDLGDFTAPSITIVDATADTLNLAFTNTDAWANEDGSAMTVAISRPANPGINFFKGPYRFADVILGDAITPPTSPTTIALPFPVEAGQRIFVFVRVTRVDGRLSASFRDTSIAV